MKMDDLISRKAAIDALAEHEKSRGHNYSMFADVVSECAEIIWDVPPVQPEQRWVPCSERLPEDDTPVLVYLFEHNKSPYIAWLSDGRWYTEDFEVERENEPVAWVPLPEPYKERKSDG